MKKISVIASATDNVAVAKMMLFIDGALKGTFTGGSFTYIWSTRGLAKGIHTITIVGYDTDGNSSSANTAVTY